MASLGTSALTVLTSTATDDSRKKSLDALCLLLPFGLALQFNVVGEIQGAEIAAIALLPFLLDLRRRRQMYRLPWLALVLLGLWLFAQIETDLIRGAALRDYARGWANIGFTMVNLVVIWTLIDGRRHRLVLFAMGIVVGLLAGSLLHPDPFAAADPWKFAYATPMMLALGTALTQGKFGGREHLHVAAFAGAAVLNLILGFRGMAGVCLLVTAYLLVQRVVASREEINSRGGPLRATTLLALGLVLTFGGLAVYRSAASSGSLGVEAEKKLNAQSRIGKGTVVDARPQVYVAMLAIRDSPIIGHGSWAKDPKYERLLPGAFGQGSNSSEPGLIPAHSHLFGAWVNAGVLGAVIWLYVLALIGRALGGLLRRRDILAPLIAFTGLSLGYDILLSPFGAERRFIIPFVIVLLLVTRRDRRHPVAVQGVS